ncbi:LCP family protein [Synechocystis sp. LKSZ1]|uniref:LCP family protein n=1 Tax=Synechocystis sp. LKSZ1 TaxID=3144951 RepID=UPI00336BDDD0
MALSAKTSSHKRSSASSQRLNKAKKGRWGWITAGFMIIALASAAGGAWLAMALASVPLRQAKLTPAQAAVFRQDKAISYQSLNLPQLSRPINVLVLGTKVLTSDIGKTSPDQGYQALVNSLEGLTDTMMVVRLDPNQGKLTLLSIPRDTKVKIPGHGTQKINAANVFGGPALAASTIEDLMPGVAIDRYLRVNVQAVEKLIDALGGVSVYVPKDMKYQDDSQHLYINLKEGQQHLNGQEALGLLRYRKDALGDIGRIQRQQLVTRAVMEQALKPQTLLKIPDIVAILQSHIDTNLTMEELVAMGGFAAQRQRSDVQMMLLPGDFSGRTGTSYWLPQSSKINALVAQHFSSETADSPWAETTSAEMASSENPSRLHIAIQDSTNNPKAVRALVRRLSQAGYRRITVVEGWRQPLRQTRILAQQGDSQGAAQVRQALGFGEVLVDSSGYLISDVTIQIGQDWQGPGQ